MPMRVRRFKVIQTANTVAMVYAVFLGVLFLIFGVFFVAAFSSSRSLGGFGFAGLGAAGLIGLVIGWVVYVIIGWVTAVIFCLAYNGAARLTGGIEFEVTQGTPPGWGQPGPMWGAPPPGAWAQQPGPQNPSWGANPPPPPGWSPPPGASWGPNPPMPRPGPAWPAQPPVSGQPWVPPRDPRQP
jgi:hypothetical protein